MTGGLRAVRRGLAPALLLLVAFSGVSSPVAQADGYGEGVDEVELALITGETVTVRVGPDGVENASADVPSSVGYVDADGYYVSAPRPGLDKFDRELFNVAYLVSEGYHEEDGTPVIVAPNDSSKTLSVANAIASRGGRVKRIYRGLPYLAAVFPAHTAALANAMMLDDNVSAVWLDRRVHPALDISVPHVGAPAVWALGYRGEGVEIAVLDTGVDAAHPDLDDLDDLATTSDPKVVLVVDFTTDATATDLNGHGTHVASIAAGTGAGSGGSNIGVAPQAKVWSVKVLGGDGSGLTSWVLAGLEYASLGPDGVSKTGDEADVINMSLADAVLSDGTDPMSVAVDAVVDQGLVVVVAAGNFGPSGVTVSIPGVARKAVTVGASDDSDVIASFSSRGPTVDLRLKPDLVAPGVGIEAADFANTGTKSLSGTSMAAPHVAGLAALLVQAHPTWTPSMVKAAMMNTALPLSGPKLRDQGAGRIRAPAAVTTTILVMEPSISPGELYASFPVSSTLTVLNVTTTSVSISLSVSTTFSGVPVSSATIEPATLVLAPGASSTVTVTIGPTGGDSLGEYDGRVTLSHSGGTITVPYLYSVALAPAASISPLSVSTTVDHLLAATTTMTLSNSGSGTLTYKLTGEGAAFTASPSLCFTPSFGTVPATSSAVVTVHLNCSGPGPGTHTSTVVLSSNDPAKGELTVPLSLNVLEPDIGVTPGSLLVFLREGQVTTSLVSVANSGVGNLSFSATVEQPNVSGGPDAFGYVWADSDDAQGPSFSWINISSTGVALGTGDDNFFSLPIGFDFPFYGVTHTTAYAGTNGLLGFASTSMATPFNDPIPLSDEPNDLIAAFWDDLEVEPPGRLLYETVGAAPNRKLVVQWDRVREFAHLDASHTFQVVLEEATQEILVQYLSMSGDLLNATVGIENSDGSVGLVTVFQGPYVKDGLAVRYSREIVYASVAPSSALLPTGNTTTVAVTLDATGLSPGTYAADVVLDTNDSNTAQVKVPVTVAVAIPSAGELALTALALVLAGLVTMRVGRRHAD